METEWTKETSLFQGAGEKLVGRGKNGLRSLPTIFKTRFPPTESLEQATKRNTLSWKLKANNNAINRSQNKNQLKVGRMRPLIKSGRKSYHNIGTVRSLILLRLTDMKCSFQIAPTIFSTIRNSDWLQDNKMYVLVDVSSITRVTRASVRTFHFFQMPFPQLVVATPLWQRWCGRLPGLQLKGNAAKSFFQIKSLFNKENWEGQPRELTIIQNWQTNQYSTVSTKTMGWMLLKRGKESRELTNSISLLSISNFTTCTVIFRELL